MKANEIEIANADKIIINRGSEDFPETDLYIWQPSSMKYKVLIMGKPTIEIPPYLMSDLVRRLFKQKLVADYSIQYEEQFDHRGRNLPTKTVAYLYLKELNHENSYYRTCDFGGSYQRGAHIVV